MEREKIPLGLFISSVFHEGGKGFFLFLTDIPIVCGEAQSVAAVDPDDVVVCCS